MSHFCLLLLWKLGCYSLLSCKLESTDFFHKITHLKIQLDLIWIQEKRSVLCAPVTYSEKPEVDTQLNFCCGVTRDWVSTNKREPRPGRVDIHVKKRCGEISHLDGLVEERVSFIYSRVRRDWVSNIESIIGSFTLNWNTEKVINFRNFIVADNDMELAHTYPASDVLDHFSVSEIKGLSLEELTLAQERYGPNGR